MPVVQIHWHTVTQETRGEPKNLTPNPFPRGKGDRILDRMAPS